MHTVDEFGTTIARTRLIWDSSRKNFVLHSYGDRWFRNICLVLHFCRIQVTYWSLKQVADRSSRSLM